MISKKVWKPVFELFKILDGDGGKYAPPPPVTGGLTLENVVVIRIIRSPVSSSEHKMNVVMNEKQLRVRLNPEPQRLFRERGSIICAMQQGILNCWLPGIQRRQNNVCNLFSRSDNFCKAVIRHYYS